MTKNLLFFFFFIFAFSLHQAVSAQDPCQPQQIHIALSDAFTSDPATNNTIKVVFHTQEECSSAYISLQTPQGSQKIAATAVNHFEDQYPCRNYSTSVQNCTSRYYSTYVHIFDFPQLDFSQTYEYSCFGTDDTFLPTPQGPFQFYLPSPNYDGTETKVVMFADMDVSPQGMPTVNALGNISQSGFTNISAFIHVGDMAYNIIFQGGKRGDDYMNVVQRFTATMPYMVTAGNHENYGNFSNFNMRFQMPNFEQSQNHYYSYNLGNMHFISFNLELILLEPQLENIMLAWLEQDLRQANQNREKQPWVIAYTHRPIYCSHDDDDCNMNPQRFANFETLLQKYEVDLMVAGHVHFYERMLPIRKGRIASFQENQYDKNFTEIINPNAPVYVLQGIAGHRGETCDPKELYKGKDFTVKVSKNLSYLSVRSQNSTHLIVENMGSVNGTIEDYFAIIRSNSSKYAQAPYINSQELKTGRSNSASYIKNSFFMFILFCLALFM